VRRINSNGNEAGYRLRPEFWQEQILWLDKGAKDADHLRIDYRDRSRSFDGREYFFVRADIFERLCSTEVLVAAPPPAPSTEPKRILRRRHSKHAWNEICAEIAAGCIDPETRHVRVPSNESKLKEDVLQWCVDTNRPQPVDSEMREAIKAICARLRKI
jgi:hypothetical protein